MLKWPLMIAIGVILIILIVAYLASPKPAKPWSYIATDASKTYIQPPGWKGTPIDAKGSFMNDGFAFYQDYLKILIWLPGHLINLVKNRSVKFSIVHHNSAAFLKENDTIIWLGHASFFLRINNKNILIDPHFNNTFIYKRHTENPIFPEFFTGIDYILLSHDHADHCDKKSLQLLIGNNPGIMILAGLNMETLLQSFVKQKVNIKTMEWYEEFTANDTLKIYFVPSKHYSKRIFKKFNSTLWGGFVIKYKKTGGEFHTIYYAGDSGYGNHFKEIGKLFNPGIAIISIGAYKPRWFMKPNHISPGEAVQAFKDCGANRMMPMHYSTFNLSNENMREPQKNLEDIFSKDKMVHLKVGEVFKFLK